MIVNGKVLDVTKYLDDHPGGEEVLIDKAGMDATVDFEDVGHSAEARKQLLKYEVGELTPSEREAVESESKSSGGMGGLVVAIIVLVAAVAGGLYFYSQ